MSSPAQTATQNPSMRIPQSVWLVIQAVSMSISAFTTSVNRPSVTMYSGREKSATMGRTIELMSPKISATTSRTTSLPPSVSAPTTSKPETNSVVSQIAKALMRMRITKAAIP